MSNGFACCALRVCCPPPAAVKALADELTANSCQDAADCASYIMAHYGLVPVAVRDAIVDSYRPLFEHAFASAAAKIGGNAKAGGAATAGAPPAV